MFQAGKDGRVRSKQAARLQTKNQAGTVPGAGMLGQHQHIRLQSLGCGTEAKPCRQGHTQGILRVQAAHIQHDAAESTSLQQEISNP
jgi:hypothetical protein